MRAGISSSRYVLNPWKCVPMSNRSRLILVVAIAAGFYLLLTAIAFHPHSPTVLSRNDLIMVAVLILGIAPIYPLYRIMRNRERVSALAILLLMCALVAGAVYLTGSLILGVDTAWTSTASVLSECLIVASCFLFIWNGFMRKNRR